MARRQATITNARISTGFIANTNAVIRLAHVNPDDRLRLDSKKNFERGAECEALNDRNLPTSFACGRELDRLDQRSLPAISIRLQSETRQPPCSRLICRRMSANLESAASGRSTTLAPTLHGPMRLGAELLAMLYLGLIATIASVSGAAYVLFRSLGRSRTMYSPAHEVRGPTHPFLWYSLPWSLRSSASYAPRCSPTALPPCC